jgi:ABC-type polysaccharide/polyol phosphate export permease
MIHLLALFRGPIYEGRSPDPLTLIVASLVAFGALVAGWLFFTARSGELAYRL